MLCVAAALIIACLGSVEGQALEIDGIKRPSFTINIGLRQSTVGPGAEIRISVELTNVSRKEIQVLRVGSGPPQYTFKVLDQFGKAAPLTPLGEAMVNGRLCYKARDGETRCIVGSSISQNRIAPGDKWTDEFLLSQYVDLSEPGQYAVRLERTDPHTKLLVESNSVSLTVAKRK
jgi:hypothetical protein